MLHDSADNRILAVRHTVDIHFGGVLEEPVEQDGSTRCDFGALRHVAANFILGVDDPHGPTAQDERGSEKKGETNLFRGNQGFLRGGGGPVGRLAKAQLIQHGGKEFSILGPFDRFDRGPENPHTGRLQFGGQIEWGLATKLDDDSLD